MLPDWMLSGLFGGAFAAVAAWGAVRVELRWHRRDIDTAHDRIDKLPCQQGYTGRRHYDCRHPDKPAGA